MTMTLQTEFERQQKEDARKSPYIHFPLSLLALFDDRIALMENAITYGVMYRARSIHQKCKQNDKFLRELDRWCPDPEPPEFDATDRRHKAIDAAQVEMGIGGWFKTGIERWADVRKRLKKLGINPDKTVFVRIPVLLQSKTPVLGLSLRTDAA